MVRKVSIAALGVILGGCLLPTGCTGKGDRIIELELFGNRFVVRDTIPINTEGKKEYTRDFTPFGQGLFDGKEKTKPETTSEVD